MGEDLTWPESADDLIAAQLQLAQADPPAVPLAEDHSIGGCFVCFERGRAGPGTAEDRGWASAAVLDRGNLSDYAVVEGPGGAPYEPGLLALREGPLLSQAVAALAIRPAVLLVNATGRDHPRRAGLALHLGAVLDIATIGVTHRPLLAIGEWPPDKRGATTPLIIDGEVVGFWVRTRPSARPLAVTSGWRTEPEQAVSIVMAAVRQVRTPEPIRQARRLARRARTGGSVTQHGPGRP